MFPAPLAGQAPDPSGLGEASFSSFLPSASRLGTESRPLWLLTKSRRRLLPRGKEWGEPAPCSWGPVPAEGEVLDGQRVAAKPRGNRAVTRTGARTNPEQLREQQAGFGPSLADSKGPRSVGRVISAGMGTSIPRSLPARGSSCPSLPAGSFSPVQTNRPRCKQTDLGVH